MVSLTRPLHSLSILWFLPGSAGLLHTSNSRSHNFSMSYTHNKDHTTTVEPADKGSPKQGHNRRNEGHFSRAHGMFIIIVLIHFDLWKWTTSLFVWTHGQTLSFSFYWGAGTSKGSGISIAQTTCRPHTLAWQCNQSESIEGMAWASFYWLQRQGSACMRHDSSVLEIPDPSLSTAPNKKKS